MAGTPVTPTWIMEEVKALRVKIFRRKKATADSTPDNVFNDGNAAFAIRRLQHDVQDLKQSVSDIQKQLDTVDAHCKNLEVKEEVLLSRFETYTTLDSQHNREQMKNIYRDLKASMDRFKEELASSILGIDHFHPLTEDDNRASKENKAPKRKHGKG